MDTIHVWIGKVTMPTAEFNQYFAINPADWDAGVGASQFDKELGTGWYDDDLIGVYYKENEDDLEAAIDELPATPRALGEGRRVRCAELGITHHSSQRHVLLYRRSPNNSRCFQKVQQPDLLEIL